jgi:tetratricopeptide (TPR) repeat protein
LGWNYYLALAVLLNTDPGILDRAAQMEQQAIALDDSLPFSHSVMAVIYSAKGQLDQAMREAERSVALDPNNAFGYFLLAHVLNDGSKPAEALVAVGKAMRLDPRRPDDYLFEQGIACTQLGRWKEGISALKVLVAHNPDVLWSHVLLADDYSSIGDDAAARGEAAEVEKAVALAPDSAPGYGALAEVMNATGRPAEALAAWRKGSV